MKERLLLFLIGITCIAFSSQAQSKIDRDDHSNMTLDGIVVFQGQIKILSTGKKFSFAFAKGDKIILKCTTEKDKKLKYVSFSNSRGSKLWEHYNTASFTKEISIKEEGVYTLELLSKGMGSRMSTVDIIRKPGNQKDFNTAWMKYSNYSYKEVEYKVDSMIGYNKPLVSQKLIKIFDKYK